jgi:hypothetical protein
MLRGAAKEGRYSVPDDNVNPSGLVHTTWQGLA